MGPTLVALTFAGIANVAHAQGTMDFSGAQTLMGTFNFSAPTPAALLSWLARVFFSTGIREKLTEDEPGNQKDSLKHFFLIFFPKKRAAQPTYRWPHYERCRHLRCDDPVRP
jgi:hypothetical protein